MATVHVMFDLETMASRRPTAAIVQIGACAFRDDELEIGEWAPERIYETKISLDDCMRHGLTVEEEVITRFWMFDASPEARAAVFKGEKRKLEPTLQDFTRWLRQQVGKENDVRVWSHATFDPPILNNAYEAVGLKLPVSFRKFRDLRTKFEDVWGPDHTAWPKLERPGALHDARADALFQADFLKMTLAEERRRLAQLGIDWYAAPAPGPRP